MNQIAGQLAGGCVVGGDLGGGGGAVHQVADGLLVGGHIA